MTVPTGTFTGYAAIGEREDLSDIIHDISPMERPFMSNVARESASAVFHEWQTDALASASSSNAVLEGDDATTDTASATTRFGNYTQIMDKVARVSGTLRAVNTAGRRDELSYQVSKRSRELMRDIETRLCAVTAGTAGAAGTARQLAGIGSWLWANQNKQGAAATTVTVSSGMPNTSPTAGTAATFTEADLKTNVQDAWTDGGDVNLVLMGIHNKSLASAFGGIATQYRDNPQVGPGTIIGAADVYVSDVGQHNLVASRFSPASNVYALDTEYWAVAYLRPITSQPLSKTGDSDRVQIITEVTLVAKQPSSSAKTYTTTTS